MSGGSLNYQYQNIEFLADDIERQFIASESVDYLGEDYLSDATSEQQASIMREVQDLIITLRLTAKRAKALEWFLSGDTGIESYLKQLTGIYHGC